MNTTINRFIKYFHQIISKRPLLFTIVGVVILSFISYSKTFEFNFYRDDWGLLWRLNYALPEYLSMLPKFRHPGEILSTYPWFYILGSSIFAWALYGLILKITVSLFVGLAVYGLTDKKEAFVLGSLLYASYFGGLEAYSWISTRFVAFMIIIICCTLYFYVKNYKQYNKGYYISLILLAILVLIEPARGILLPPFLILLEILKRFINKDLISKKLVINVAVLISVTLIMMMFTASGTSITSGSSDTKRYLGSLFTSSSKIKLYFNSFANLIIPYYKSINELVGLASFNKNGAWQGVYFIIIGLTSGVILTLKRKNIGSVILLSTLWVPLFFLPGWLSDMDVNAGGAHRYLAISAVAVVFIFTAILIELPRKYLITIFFLITAINLYRSIEILNNDYQLKAYSITQPLYQKMIDDIPKGEKQSMVIVGGRQPALRGSAFDFAAGGTLPVAVISKIDRREDIPVPIPEYKLAADLVCYENIRRPYFDGWDVQKNKSSIEKLYSWQITEEKTLLNDSSEKRIIIAHLADCLTTIQDKQISSNLSLKSTVTLDKLYESNKKATSFKWEINDKNIKKVETNIKIYNKYQNEIKTQSDLIEPQKISDNILITTIYQNKNEDTATSALISGTICSENCDSIIPINISLEKKI